MFLGRIRVVHFVGIGGIGMSGLAEVLLGLGLSVTGSDAKDGPDLARLRSVGATVHVGHRADQLGRPDLVVRTSAAREGNPELVAARVAGIPVITRGELLAELMRPRTGVAVAGTHGKTTTTSMTAACLIEADLDPTVIVGGRLPLLHGGNARLGAGEHLVAESDESDGSFLRLSPAVAVITNVEPEHLDHYGSVEALDDAFVAFAEHVPFYGAVVLCRDQGRLARLADRITRRKVTYGTSPEADLRAVDVVHEGLGSRFRVLAGGDDLGTFTIRMPGAHNVANALGALAAAREVGVDVDVARRALAAFTGVQRRFTLRGEAGGVTVVDDYAHHPTELAATLGAARGGYAGRRIVAVFQPHRYTRTKDLLPEFAACFDAADEVVLLPIYAASEDPLPGVDHEALAAAIRAHGHRSVATVGSLDEAVAHVARRAAPGDVVLALGAGSVSQLCDPLLARLGGGA